MVAPVIKYYYVIEQLGNHRYWCLIEQVDVRYQVACSKNDDVAVADIRNSSQPRREVLVNVWPGRYYCLPSAAVGAYPMAMSEEIIILQR